MPVILSVLKGIWLKTHGINMNWLYRYTPHTLVAALMLVLLCAQHATADNQPQPAFDLHANLSGLWQSAESDHAKNDYLIIAQEDNAIFVSHYLEWKGQPLIEHGSGLRDGDTIHYAVRVSRGIPGWAVAGTHHLTLSPDGKTLSGHFKDNRGNTGPIKFTRKGL
jgi:hypothetical protein